MSVKRHLFTAIILAPALAQLLGRGKGWLVDELSDPVVWTAACYDQLDARDENVLMKSLFCGLKYGISRGVVERNIGGRRERVSYVEMLAKVCQEGLRDMGYGRGMDGVCWIGGVGLDEWGEGEASEREWFKRGFEECHARFGVDAKLDWRGDVRSPLQILTHFLFEDGEIVLMRDAATAHQIQDAGNQGHAIQRRIHGGASRSIRTPNLVLSTSKSTQSSDRYNVFASGSIATKSPFPLNASRISACSFNINRSVCFPIPAKPLQRSNSAGLRLSPCASSGCSQWP